MNHRKSRRRFAKAIAAALIAAPLAPRTSSAQTPPATKQAPAPPQPAASPAPQNPSPLAEAYAEVARARFGAPLTPEELSRIKRDLEGNIRAAERLRAFKLQNGDEPDFVFSA
jgi:hypothetical protein